MLTDGEVSNTDQLIALTKQYAHRARVFTFGLGEAVSTQLVTAIARAGHGEAEFVTANDLVRVIVKCVW